MPLKQSAFNFDFIPDEKTSGGNPATPENNPVLQEEAPGIPEAEIIIEAGFVGRKEKKENIATGSSSADYNTPKKSPRGRMKLSDMNASAELIEVPDDAVLFEKSYYSIGAVSDMFKVNQSLIRFWENEFSILKPKKNAKGDRFFRPEDVKNLKLIYHLLRERKYTIEGAKEFLKKNKNADKKFEMVESLKNLKAFLNELKASL
jgi:DNA-binding transcriptional MerR regulator